MGGVEKGATGRFVHAARLHSNESVFDEIDSTNAVASADGVECANEFDGVELCSVNRHGRTVDEADDNFLGLVRRFLWSRCQHE